jgi:hypothetical protein
MSLWIGDREKGQAAPVLRLWELTKRGASRIDTGAVALRDTATNAHSRPSGGPMLVLFDL